MKIEALSTIPEVFGTYMASSIMGNAVRAGALEFSAYNLHDWGLGNYQRTDDRPFGGGAGQLMICEPIFAAVRELKERAHAKSEAMPRVIFFTPSGALFDQRVAERLSREEHLLFVCGRFEGIDERAYSLADECLSLGDYVLTGGELPAMVVADAVVRLLPGVLGNEQSAVDESFSVDGLLEYAQYTHPANFEGMEVPEVLRSGNHAAIAAWRRQSALERTAQLRPDLLDGANLSDDERAFALKVIEANSAKQGESK